MAKNLNLQEQINEAFIEVANEYKESEYATYLRAINREVIANIDNLTIDKVNEIVNRQIGIKETVILFSILSAITTILNNNKTDTKQRESILPVLAIMGLYSVSRPKVFAKRMLEVITTPKTRISVSASKNLLQTKELLNEYIVRNEAAINNSIKQTQDNMVRTHKKYVNNLTRAIRKDINTLVDENRTKSKVEKLIKEKYKVTDNIVKRNLDTEIHAQAETVKLETAKANGYTHKTWKTQGDSKVRKTNWHNGVANKRIPIDSEFRAAGMVASRPADTRLPVGERVRCRCYLVFD